MLLFVLAQTAAVIHAEVHPFHEHSAYCDAFDQASEPRVHSAFFSFLAPGFSTPEYLPTLYSFVVQIRAYASYSVRAPPSLNP
ncbi:hypothetical protein [Thiomicrorhabdus xiamenensis]|uniref:Uncharacterized protein n=1 Tax=Thiomicrorhabdus xiamenensis TaxID=2739063 RepID=A0A7D4TC52_9GAMM|nr:hypothetical protein [Thiomicrorhabdus xiamenensis]QKI90086.1 hypothetical protein HQN79_11125 [Thiomicrorhabdus xiamenensis]